jgi:hypothetical protein
MVDRRFTEVDPRAMLSRARRLRRDCLPGRWRVETTHRRKPWVVIVEPDRECQMLVVVTAYPVEECTR